MSAAAGMSNELIVWYNLIWLKKNQKKSEIKKNNVIFRFAEFVEKADANNVEISVANVVERWL